MRLADYVIEFLEKQGVKHIFMISGGGCMYLVDAIGKSETIRYVCNGNEQAVSICAEAYAQYDNELGVGLVTTGPGGTNALTGVAAAFVDSTPMLIISGQVKTADLAENCGVRQFGFQEINIVDMVKPITKYAKMVKNPNEIKASLEEAIYTAKEGRPGPVWVDIPLDVQGSEINPDELIGYEKQPKSISVIEEDIRHIKRLLKSSRRPCVLLGNGIRLGDAMDEMNHFISKYKIPFLLTWKAADFFDEEHPLNCGRPGAIGQRAANFIQQTCDLLIVIGSRLDLGQTAYNHKNFAIKANKVIIDIDEKEIGKLDMKVDVGIAASAKEFFDAFEKEKSAVEMRDLNPWVTHCQSLKKRYPVVLTEFWKQEKYVNYYCFIEVLAELLSSQAVIVPGSSGSCSEVTMQAFKVKKGQRLYNNQGLGSMGFGIAAAIAGALVSGKETVLIDGDGGFQFNIQELETVARLGLPIKMFILNNQGYGAITNMQRNHFGGKYVASEANSGVTLADVTKLATAYGIPSLRISNNEELKKGIDMVLKSNGPIICDLMIDPMQLTLFRSKSEKLPDGSMVSKPMEDLWPFLDRVEFSSAMNVEGLYESEKRIKGGKEKTC